MNRTGSFTLSVRALPSSPDSQPAPKAGSDPSDPLLCLAPAESCFVAGLNVAPMCKLPEWQRAINDLKTNPEMAPMPELPGLIEDLDRVVISGGKKGAEPFVVVGFSFLKPHAKELRALAKRLKMKPAGKDGYDLSKPGESIHLDILNEQLCVLGTMPKPGAVAPGQTSDDPANDRQSDRSCPENAKKHDLGRGSQPGHDSGIVANAPRRQGYGAFHPGLKAGQYGEPGLRYPAYRRSCDGGDSRFTRRMPTPIRSRALSPFSSPP